ncbi:hypothetical protein PQX77_001163 [Marasmius sp. AFHP31]|nr:hypothetical protein PQX77_001163 [Marasmius sp. AFHP31]
MHYSAKHDMDVTPDGNFQRMVVERKGSYCYGKNGMLLEMLRGVGYRAYAAQGRVSEHLIDPEKEPKYTPLVHLVLFVQPFEGKGEKTTYLVDAGFGGGGLVRPILLEDGATVAGGTSSETFRLSKGPHPKSVLDNSATLSWRFEVQHQRDPSGPPTPWKVLYSFSETEFFQSDCEQSSYFVATHPNGSSFLQQVVCVKYVYLDDQKEDLGYTTLWRDHMRQHSGAQTKDLPEIKTEEERLERIREFYGIDVGEGAIEHIKGRNAELKAA